MLSSSFFPSIVRLGTSLPMDGFALIDLCNKGGNSWKMDGVE